MADSWEFSHYRSAKRLLASLTVASGLGAAVFPSSVLGDEGSSTLADQLRVMQAQQTKAQKERYESAESKAVNQELKYKAGSVLARGAVLLYGEDPSAARSNREFPLGYEHASQYDPAFGSDESTIFLIAVGRQDGVPCAVKKLHTKDVSFPMVFEMLDSDLIFPYTADAWASGPQALDSVVVTCIMSTTNTLSEPDPKTRLGYAISEPVQIAGSIQRSTARVIVNSKVDNRLYTAEETALLKGIDEQLTKKPYSSPVSP